MAVPTEEQELYHRIRCPHCVWWQTATVSVGMTPCPHCNSSGYIYEAIAGALKEVKR